MNDDQYLAFPKNSERQLLAACLNNHGKEVSAEITPVDFHSPSNRALYAAILVNFKKFPEIDFIGMAQYVSSLNENDKDKELAAFGWGTTTLMKLSSEFITSSMIEYHISEVKNFSKTMKTAFLANELTQSIYDNSVPISQKIRKSIEDLSSLLANNRKVSIRTIANALEDSNAMLDAIHAGESAKGIETGFFDLDGLIRLRNSELVVVAGRPSMGKSTFVKNVILNLAASGVHCGTITAEDSEQMFVMRCQSTLAGLDYRRIERAELSGNEWEELTEASSKLHDYPISIADLSSPAIHEIEMTARALVKAHGAQALFVDHIGLIRGYRKEGRSREIGAISESLKGLAKELDVPVVAVSQLSRKVEDRNPPRPILSDLRDSGEIEQNADIVMFLYRGGYYYKDAPGGDTVDVIVAKNRNGPTGDRTLYFDLETGAMRDLQLHERLPQDTEPTVGGSRPCF